MKTETGLYTIIYIRIKPNLEYPFSVRDKNVTSLDHPSAKVLGATHQVQIDCLYYSKGYPRGPWPDIAAVLMTLLASKDVKKVWYGFDQYPQVINAAEVNAISAHYMAHGYQLSHSAT